jgi:hypothetical protein
MSDIVTGRQLRAARILAGLTQKQFAKAVGVYERAARYWESKENKLPTAVPDSLEKNGGGPASPWGGCIFVANARCPACSGGGICRLEAALCKSIIFWGDNSTVIYFPGIEN